jgi:hypothetical protein
VGAVEPLLEALEDRERHLGAVARLVRLLARLLDGVCRRDLAHHLGEDRERHAVGGGLLVAEEEDEGLEDVGQDRAGRAQVGVHQPHERVLARARDALLLVPQEGQQ